MRAKKLATVVKEEEGKADTRKHECGGETVSLHPIYRTLEYDTEHCLNSSNTYYTIYISLNLCLKDTMKYDRCVFKYNSTA